MPLTDYQFELAQLLAQHRTPDSYLAGGAALHFAPNTLRYSNDLDYFHDSIERVAEAYAQDRALLETHGYSITVQIHQPGFIRTVVAKAGQATKVEWAHDSAWRFMPTQFSPECGYTLHPVDLALNKVLALVGRNEPRDYLDVHDAHTRILSLGGLCWAACGKDPGLPPHALLALLRRRGTYRREDFDRLQLQHPVDVVALKSAWLQMLDDAAHLIDALPPDEVGCLYYSTATQQFETPQPAPSAPLIPHYGRIGGVLPCIVVVNE